MLILRCRFKLSAYDAHIWIGLKICRFNVNGGIRREDSTGLATQGLLAQLSDEGGSQSRVLGATPRHCQDFAAQELMLLLGVLLKLDELGVAHPLNGVRLGHSKESSLATPVGREVCSGPANGHFESILLKQDPDDILHEALVAHAKRRLFGKANDGLQVVGKVLEYEHTVLGIERISA